MAEVADGWAAYGQPLEVISHSVPKIRRRMAELGRDPGKFNVRIHLHPVFANGRPDLDATLATIPKLLDAGATHVEILVVLFCSRPDDFEPFIRKCIEARERYRRD
jgi:hypothetical protein